ncbi:MAG TPA: Yip1 family protein [Woeseiaceae bacterium]|nr:Yip1 family protein [Woeseiaceae bacterium]
MTDIVETSGDLSPNPWFSIWLQPRATIQHIVDTDPRRLVLVLAASGGIVEALNRASSKSLGDSLGLPAIFSIGIVVGAISGILSLFVFGALIRWTGRWLGGTASYEQIRAAIAWSLVPYLWTSLTWIPELLLFGEEMFTTEMPRLEANPTLAFVFLGLIIVELIGGVWALVVYLKCLGQVQGFSAWKALGNVFLATLVFVVPIVLVVAVSISASEV